MMSESLQHPYFNFYFFFNDTATTEIYTLSLHDALPISQAQREHLVAPEGEARQGVRDPDQRAAEIRREALADRQGAQHRQGDRKSTRLNSSHSQISYAVFCLKKKKKQAIQIVHSVPLYR